MESTADNKLIKQIEDWALKVIETFSPLAEASDLAFYPLQSKVKVKPKVLILGLNPGTGHPYTRQKADPMWEFKKLEIMSVDRLLKGNPYFGEVKPWPIIKGLQTIHFCRETLEEEDFCFMNYYYLSTSNFNDVLANPLLKDSLAVSKAFTFEFIDLIQPSMILVLGTANGIDFLDFSDKESILNGRSQRLLVKATYKDIPVLAIPHPSWLILTAEEIQALDTNIRETLNRQPLTKYSFQNRYTRLDVDKLNSDIKPSGLQFIEKSPNIYDCSFLGIQDEELFLRIVLKPHDKYWGLRSTKLENGSRYDHLKFGDRYIKSILDEKTIRADSWLVKKELKAYASLDETELHSFVMADFLRLMNTIKDEVL